MPFRGVRLNTPALQLGPRFKRKARTQLLNFFLLSLESSIPFSKRQNVKYTNSVFYFRRPLLICLSQSHTTFLLYLFNHFGTLKVKGAHAWGGKGPAARVAGAAVRRGEPPEILRPLCEAGGEEANYRMPSSAGQTYGGQEWGGRRKRGQNTEKRGK